MEIKCDTGTELNVRGPISGVREDDLSLWKLRRRGIGYARRRPRGWRVRVRTRWGYVERNRHIPR